YWLPEGGAQTLALKGVAELIEEITIEYNLLCVACGTGTTLAGLITAVNKNVQVLGFAALKHAEFLNHDVNNLLPYPYSNWQINQNYHFGGFAKTNLELMQFIQTFKQLHNIELEPIYTGKMLYGLYNLIKQGQFDGKRIIAIHTGGLQGNRGFNDNVDDPKPDYYNTDDCHNMDDDNHVANHYNDHANVVYNKA
ncbi:partial L-cysteate sulfo-lyase, partial [Patescibacteria group bacterium]